MDSINGYAISYDTIGNPEVYRNGTVDSWDDSVTYYMNWENGRQLTYLEVWGDWQERITYDYDADGIRTYKNVEGVTHSYVTQNGKVVRETIGSGTTAKVLDFIYDESGKPFALNYSTDGGSTFTTYYYVLNLQGDVVKLVEHVYDEDTDTYSLSTVASYTYTAWGEILTASGTMASINPLRYRGYYYDTETGFYYLQSRYYDPVLHRFVNADTAEYSALSALSLNGTNLFAYCQNNPVSFGDENGEWLHILVGAVVGAAVSFVTSVVEDISNGEEIDWTGAAVSAAFGAAEGALSATGLGPVAQIAGGALLSGGEEFVRQGIEKGFENIDYSDVAKSAIEGGFCSIGNGVGTNNKYLHSQSKKLFNRIKKNGMGELKQGLEYYIKHTKKLYYKELFDSAKDELANAFKDLVR